jgi:hypothetical protein
MSSWRGFENQVSIQVIGLLVFAVIAVGTAVSSWRRQTRSAVTQGLLLVSVILILTGGNGALGGVFAFLQTHVPLFGQIFRTVFTKWSIAAAFIYAWGIGTAVFYLGQLMTGWKRGIFGVVTVLLVAGMMVVCWPIWQGKLFYQ